MKFRFVLLLIVISASLCAQQLTIEKIMRDPKWIGTQPSNPYWSSDSKIVYFNWNPEKNISDSTYQFMLNTNNPAKCGYNESAVANAIAKGKYNRNFSKLVYAYHGDLYQQDIKTSSTSRITQTEEIENDPSFINNDQWIIYTKADNLFEWNTSSGITKQLTNFVHIAEPAAIAAGKTNKDTTAAKQKNKDADKNLQETFLKEIQMQTSDVLKARKEKEEAKKAFLKNEKSADTLKMISIANKEVQELKLSPDGKFITYRLYEAPVASRNTIVPNYVTESGFTTDIPGRTKVGEHLGKTSFYLYDIDRDTIIIINTDSIPGISDAPEYEKDYPEKFSDKKKTPRAITIYGPYWNEAATQAFVDIRSQDYKDRWLMLLDKTTAKLSLIDRQHDEAWIGGPGIEDDDEIEQNEGWLDNNNLYFESEATGYAHLYTYHTLTAKKAQLTSGNYEVQNLVLSRNKKYFYLLTNEEHPGKQNWYRINADGSSKEKITSMTGGYEVKMSPDEKYIAYCYSYSNKPWELYVQENQPNKKPVQITNKSRSDEFKTYAWRDPQMVIIPASDGASIYGRLYEPDPAKKNGAAVIFVHGAGYLQNAHYWWSSYFREYMFHNLLADKGYTVIDVDYRASKGYGRNWRTGIYRYMGGKDLDDNIDAINWLIKNKGIDAKRVGMYGGSYGGFITLMTLFTKPDVVKAGAALRPVTDWAHYNHGYTARILNEPFTDSIAYTRSSPINFAAGLKNHLLICHGMIDTNVNFQDVVRLTQRLIELGKDDWQLAPYPLEDHGFVEPSSWTDEYKRILKLFDDNLLKAGN